MFNLSPWTQSLRGGAVAGAAAALFAGSAAHATEEFAVWGKVDLFTFVNEISPEPLAAEGAPPGVNLQYAVSADRGRLESWHSHAACCGSHSNVYAQCQFDDVVFSTPGGEPGSVIVSLNLLADGAYTANPPCGTAAAMHVWLRVGPPGNSGWIGTWSPGGTLCTQVPPSGIFIDEVGTTLSGMYTGPTYTVPLNEPLIFQLKVEGYIGTGGNNLGVMDAAISFPTVGDVFNIVSGPKNVTVNSTQGNIVNNEWHGIPADCPSDITGDQQVNIDDLLLVISSWGPCGPPCPADIDGSGSVNIDDLLAVIGDWGPCS